LLTTSKRETSARVFNHFLLCACIIFLTLPDKSSLIAHPVRIVKVPGKVLEVYYETAPFFADLVTDENIISLKSSAWDEFKGPEKEYSHSLIRTIDATLPNGKKKKLIAKLRETEDIQKFISEYKAYRDLTPLLLDLNKWIRTDLCFIEKGERITVKVPVRVFKPRVMMLGTLHQRGKSYAVIVSDLLIDIETRKIAPSLLQITRIIRGRSEKAKKYSEDKGAKRALILAFGRVVGFLHGTGHQWHDPYDKNILVSTRESGGRISEINLGIIDMEGSAHTKASKMGDVIASRRQGYIDATAYSIKNILYSYSLEETNVGLRSAELFMRGVKEGLIIGCLRTMVSDFDHIVRNIEGVKDVCLYIHGKAGEDVGLLAEDIRLTLSLDLSSREIKGIFTALRFVDAVMQSKEIRETYQRLLKKKGR
jgi:hypothetical protein